MRGGLRREREGAARDRFLACCGIPQGSSGGRVRQGATSEAACLRLTLGKKRLEYLGGRDRGEGQDRIHDGQLCGLGSNDTGNPESKSGQLA